MLTTRESRCVHLPVSPSRLANLVRGSYGYFRSGVKVEGEATLCENAHSVVMFLDSPVRRVAQHIDVTLRLWNRRGGRVTVIDVADAWIVGGEKKLTGLDSWFGEFKPITLEEGDKPQECSLVVVPADNENDRVEASVGDVLILEFRQTRGSERWARPRVELQLR